MSTDPTPAPAQERLQKEQAVRRNAVRRFYSTLCIAGALAGFGTGARIVFLERDTRNICFAIGCFVVGAAMVAFGHMINTRMELED